MRSILKEILKLPSGQEMKEWDKAAVRFGIPEHMLMENAGRVAFEQARALWGSFKNKNVCIFIGSGNNGGDGSAMARHIQDEGGYAKILSLKPPETITGYAEWHLNLAVKNGASFTFIDISSLASNDQLLDFLFHNHKLPILIVDAITGTGLKNQLKPEYATFINLCNNIFFNLDLPVLSLDIPSGLDSESGAPLPIAIKAHATITFEAPKPGLLMPSAREYTGKLFCRKIGIPNGVLPSCPARYHLLDGQALNLFYAPLKPQNSFKNAWGHICIVGGTAGHTGAAHLAALGGLRTGVGLVTVLAPGKNLQMIKADSPEIMTYAAGDTSEWPLELSENAIRFVINSDCLVLGPGMGTSKDASRYASLILKLENRPPAILDADILQLIGRDEIDKACIKENDVLTPHPGEAGALLNISASQIQRERMHALDELCSRFPGIIILKGACTLIGKGEEKRVICPYDLISLAMGGAGDVLAGCIAAFMASRYNAGWSAFSKACFGVITHALAGLLLAQKFPERGALASELAFELPNVCKLLNRSKPDYVIPWPEY